MSADFERAAETACVEVELNNRFGNLEGFLESLHGYQRLEHRPHMIHRFDLAGQPIYCSLVATSRAKSLIAAFSVQPILDRLTQPVKSQAGGSADKMIALRFEPLPRAWFTQPPFASLSALVQQLEVTVAEEADQLKLEMALNADNEVRALQLQQKIEQFLTVLNDPSHYDLRITRVGSEIQMTTKLSSAAVLALIE